MKRKFVKHVHAGKLRLDFFPPDLTISSMRFNASDKHEELRNAFQYFVSSEA
jgi:hypothetical protein